MRGQALMPCSTRKARLLLKDGKAVIVKYNPFTIQLKYATGEAKQPCNIGIDTGARHIGVAVSSGKKVFYKGEIELRQDISSLLETRKIYRRSRRNRKTRYRQARFLNRKKPEGWLPPSLQSRVNAINMWIDRFCELIPRELSTLRIEVGKFDAAKMINPDIGGVDYQHGQTYGYYDVRYYVFARDEYTCQVCKKKNKILNTHHIVFKSMGGTDRADNLITVCTDCHTSDAHKEGGILYKWCKEHKKVKQYKETAFMNALRIRMFQRVFPASEIQFTYGSETVVNRKALGLEKTHYNDAIAISGIKEIKENPHEWIIIRQFRKKKRSLHEATARKGIKEPNRTQKRNNKNVKSYKGWFPNDKVFIFGKTGYIYSFTNGGARVKDSDEQYITVPGKSYSQVPLSKLKLRCHNNSWQLLPQLKQEDSVAKEIL